MWPDAHSATIVGDWEEPSGESLLTPLPRETLFLLQEGTVTGFLDMHLFLPALIVLVSLATMPARAGQPADLELMLAVDVSGSVDDGEFELQMRGLAEAFRHPAVQAAIRGAGDNGVAVALMQWSDGASQEMPVDWTLLRDSESAIAFADRIAATGREILGGGTSIYGAINFSIHALDRNGFDGRRRTIDISGDGRSDLFVPTVAARDRAVARGILINGLAILNDYPTLDRYYSRNVIGGIGAFVMTATDYQSFTVAIIAKLIREITGALVAKGPSSIELAAGAFATASTGQSQDCTRPSRHLAALSLQSGGHPLGTFDGALSGVEGNPVVPNGFC